MYKYGRWYFKQVHFYSVFLSICYIAQNQCVSFHKVLQWFIFLQGLRVSKHTVFPVRKLNTSSPKLLLAYWDPYDVGGDLLNVEYSSLAMADLSLTNERLSSVCLVFLTVSAVMSTTQIGCSDYVDLYKLCSFVLKTPESSFEII